jgi:hypothetical protein
MWKKILIGIIALIVIVVTLALFLTRGLSEVANNQLQAIKKGDTITAYSYTSKDFQSAVSLKNFEKFIDRYPVLKNNKKISWGERSFEGNTGLLKGDLTAADGGVSLVEYHFIKENGIWKVLGIGFNPSGIQNASPAESTQANEKVTTANNKAQGEIYQILVSDTQGPKRSVDIAKPIIPTAAPKVFASVYVLNAKAGVRVDVKMIKVDNGTVVAKNSAKITQNGNVIRDFSFTNVDKTWPAGDYRVDVTTSNQQSATVNFKIQ